jgi:cytidyltransferase-like protein
MNVFTAGCFDILHSGHINLLLFCRQLAGPNGKVHVSLDDDEKIKRDKGDHRPIFTWNERFNQIHQLQFNGQRIVDYIYKHESNEDLQMVIRSKHDFFKKDTYIVVGDSYKGKPVIGDDIGTVVHLKQSDLSSTMIESVILKAHNV